LRVLTACCVSEPLHNWVDVVQWSSVSLKGKGLWTILCKLALGASVYNIWRQRNALIHGNTPRTEEQIIEQIRRDVNLTVALTHMHIIISSPVGLLIDICPPNSHQYFLVLC